MRREQLPSWRSLAPFLLQLHTLQTTFEVCHPRVCDRERATAHTLANQDAEAQLASQVLGALVCRGPENCFPTRPCSAVSHLDLERPRWPTGAPVFLHRQGLRRSFAHPNDWDNTTYPEVPAQCCPNRARRGTGHQHGSP